MVWFDETDSKIALPNNVKTLSAEEAELMLPTFSWFESETHEELLMPELSKFQFPQKNSLFKEKIKEATMNIPRYPLFAKQKGNDLNPSLIRKQTGEWTYKKQFLNYIKFRVH